jgi:hypothetical protein
MSGWKDWTVGEVVEESDFQSFVQDQVVQVYDSSTARGSALGTAVAEGMVSYLKDTNATEVFTGASWEAITGDITGVTAGTALTGGGTSGAVTLNVDQSELFTDGTEGLTMVSGGTAGVTYQPISPNYIINGAFDIWQRGTSFTGITGSNYTADRWAANASGGTMSISRQTFSVGELEVAGFGEADYYARVECTSANDNVGLRYRNENVKELAGQQVTISFYAKAVTSMPLRAQIQQAFGSGGSATTSITFEDFTIGTSWARYTATTTIDSVSGKTIGSSPNLTLFLVNPNNETFTLDIWGVQLEAGSVATPFRRNANSIQGELAACQRYYWKSQNNEGFGTGYGTTNLRMWHVLPVTMRTSPTVTAPSLTNIVTKVGVGNQTATGISTSSKENQVIFTLTGLPSDTSGRPFDWNASVEFSAEL